MAFCRLVFPILVLSAVSCYANLQVPVFLWGDLKTSIKSNPITVVSESEFQSIVEEEIKGDQVTVIFADGSLSVEDLSRKNEDGETSFPYLHANIGKAVYLPAVEDPIAVLKNLEDPEKVDHIRLTENGLSAEFEPESVKILFITLKDARVGESRASLLRRHNDFMQEMYTKLQAQYKSVVAIYTAEFPSWVIPESHSRVRRQAELSINDYTFNGLKLYVKELVLSVNKEKTNLNSVSSQSSMINGTVMETTIGFGENTLTLNFTQKMGYWYFSTVILHRTSPTEVTEVLYPTEEVYAIRDFSYRCGQDITFTSVNDTITYSVVFSNLKVQPFFKETNSSLVFGDSLNCVGFFTVPIWSGLFVTFILLAITFYGIMMMMDIRTMDRFDDPKGKTITINANE